MVKMITNNGSCGLSSLWWILFLHTLATGNFCKCLHLANAFIHLCDLAFNVSVNKTVKFWLQ